MAGTNTVKTYKKGEKCGTCQYRGSDFSPEKCNYAIITGKCRLCPVVGCTKYEEGPRIRVEAPEVIEPAVDVGSREYYGYTVERNRKQGTSTQPRYKYR
jgi:hypothetical protein